RDAAPGAVVGSATEPAGITSRAAICGKAGRCSATTRSPLSRVKRWGSGTAGKGGVPGTGCGRAREVVRSDIATSLPWHHDDGGARGRVQVLARHPDDVGRVDRCVAVEYLDQPCRITQNGRGIGELVR